MGGKFGDHIRHGDAGAFMDKETVQLTEHAVLMCQLAEHQDKLDEIVDQETVDYLHAQEYARQKLQDLRKAINIRDAMTAVRKYVGGA